MRDHEEKDKLEDVESVLCTFLFSLPLRPALTFSCFLYLPLSGGVELMVTFSELDYQSDYPFIMGSSGSTSILADLQIALLAPVPLSSLLNSSILPC